MQRHILDMEEKITERKNRFLEVAAQLSENSQNESASLYRLALDSFLAGRIDEALGILNEDGLWEAECQQAEQRILRGNMLYFQNRLQEAEYNMRRAVEIAPLVENFILLGHFYSNSGRCGQACSVYRRALPVCTNDFERAKVFTEMGQAHLKMNNPEVAEQYINEGYTLFIKYVSDQCRKLPVVDCLKISSARAYLALERHDYEAAEKIFREIIDTLNDFGEVEQLMDFKAWTLFNFARMLGETGRQEEALSIYAISVSLYEVLAAKEPDLNKIYLAQALREYAGLLSSDSNYELQESYLLRAYDLTHDGTIPHFWHKTLTVEVLVSLCLLYDKTCSKEMMQPYLFEARDLFEEIYKQDPDLYLPKYCYVLDRLCMSDDEDVQTESIKRGMEAYREMSGKLQESWSGLGAWFYFRMAQQLETDVPDQAKDYFILARELACYSKDLDIRELAYMENYITRYMLTENRYLHREEEIGGR